MNSAKILLIEDSEEEAVFIQRAFRKRNMVNEIVHVKSGEEALHFLFSADPSSASLPALVIINTRLPGMTGLDVLKSLRAGKATNKLPVIILTTTPEQEQVVAKEYPVASSCVRRPMEYDKFLDAVGTLGLCWTVLNKPNTKYHG